MSKDTPELVVIGAPSSAGAYAPGQEKAPAALRAAGLVENLRSRLVRVADQGDVPGFRWQPDPAHPRAMNFPAVATVAKAVAAKVGEAFEAGNGALVLGGDCTVEIGTVAGAAGQDGRTGLIYIDLDTDLNTPESTADGALDWMGVAHLLSLPGTVTDLASVASRRPLLRPGQVLFFAHANVEPFERRTIDELRIAEVPCDAVARNPVSSAGRALKWAAQFDRLLIHLDVDVLNYVEMPLAENVRRNLGLGFDELVAALTVLLRAPNLAALTVAELNPDHASADGASLRRFVDALAAGFGNSRFANRGF